MEKGSLFERGVTLLLVLLQLYPQYRALRIILMRSHTSSQLHFQTLNALIRLKFIDSLTVEMEEEIYITKLSYIEPIFEGGLQVIVGFFSTNSSLSKVAVQLYLIYMMTTKVHRHRHPCHFRPSLKCIPHLTLCLICCDSTRIEASLISRILLMTRGTHGKLKLDP